MKAIPIIVPEGCIVRGSLHAPDNPAVFSGTMLWVELPKGVEITVGWYPARPPDYYPPAAAGYVVDACTFSGHQLESVRTPDVEVAAETVRRLAKEFCESAVKY
jgi:hypothetical protein